MITIDMPFPPSANRLWRISGKRNVLSEEAKKFYAHSWSVRVQHKGKSLTERLSVHIDLYPSRRGIDIDNRAKACLDLLQKSGVIANDSQVDVLTIVRQQVVKGGKCVVSIETVEELAA